MVRLIASVRSTTGFAVNAIPFYRQVFNVRYDYSDNTPNGTIELYFLDPIVLTLVTTF